MLSLMNVPLSSCQSVGMGRQTRALEAVTKLTERGSLETWKLVQATILIPIALHRAFRLNPMTSQAEPYV